MKHKINLLVFVILLLITVLVMYKENLFLTIVSIICFIFLVILTTGVLFMKFNYFLKSIIKLNSNHVLLTFDDGPHPKFTPIILEILSKHNIKAIFFIIGNKGKNNPKIVKRIIDEGHLIGNHSQNHNPMISLFSKSKLMKEIISAQNTIKEITSTNTNIFRPPVGYTNPNYAFVLQKLKIKCIGWTLRSYDTIYKTPEKLVKRLVSKTKPKSIILLHDNLLVTASALDKYINETKKNGIKFVSSNEIKNIFDE